MVRRTHHKVTQFLPPELVEAVNKLLVEGATYQEITDWLNGQGHQISKSSLGRYGKDFLSRLERLRVVRDQARAIVEDNADRPSTELNEAAGALASQLITEALLAAGDAGKGLDKKMTEAIKALALLERSAVARERLKLDYTKGVDAALNKLKDQLKNELANHPEILEQIYRVVDRVAEETKV